MVAVSTLKVNFFSVPMGEEELPFFARPLGAGESLRPGELRWERNSGESEPRQLLAALTMHRPDATGYQSVPAIPDVVPPGIIKALLRTGLENSLRSARMIVEADHLGLACFRPEEVVRENVPPFVAIRRGVEFRSDHFTADGRHIYGFFVSTKVRVQFRDNLADDDRLASAALQERVVFSTEHDAGSGTLVRVDRLSGIAVIVDDRGRTCSVPQRQVHVPASPRVLSRYCQLLGQADLARQVRRAALMATYRLGRSGQKNRRWLADQMSQVRSWLIAASQYDRLHFTWPNSTRRLFVQTRPVEVVERSIS